MPHHTKSIEQWNSIEESEMSYFDGPTRREIEESVHRAESAEKRPANQATRGDALLEAHRIVNGERLNAYGKPENAFFTVAELWNAYLEPQTGASGCFHLTPHNVAVMLALLKVGRLAHNPCHHDSHVDGAAYLALADDMTQLCTGPGEAQE